MNICMLSELFYPYDRGGAERRFMEISKRLAKSHNVSVYSLRLKGQKQHDVWNGVNIHRYGLPHPVNVRSLPVLMSYISPLLRSMQKKYDIVHANQGMALFAGMLRSSRVVATFHDLYGYKWNEYYPFPLSTAGMFFENLWSHIQFSRIIANSEQTKRKLTAFGFDSPVETIISGVDLEFISRINAEKSDFVLYVGRLEPYKHVDVLIKAMNKLKWKLKIIGDGSEISKLKRMSGDNIEFLGYVSEKRKIEEMKKARVLVNLSDVEGLGLAALEAMACGTIPVIRNLECYREFADNKNSFIIDDMNEDALIRTIEKAMVCRKRGNAIKTAEKFSWDETAKKVERVYNDVLL